MDDNKIKSNILNSTDDKLQTYITNYHKYKPQYLAFVLEETDRRNIYIPDNERAVIEDFIQKGGKEETVVFNHEKQKHLYVEDSDAPLLYTKIAITIFSILFMSIFGSVLMYINLKKNRYKGASTVLLFGIVYAIITIIIINNLPQNISGIQIAFNGLAALILNSYFWPKYIGNETKFRKKPIWKPLIISLLITIPLIIFVIKYGDL